MFTAILILAVIIVSLVLGFLIGSFFTINMYLEDRPRFKKKVDDYLRI